MVSVGVTLGQVIQFLALNAARDRHAEALAAVLHVILRTRKSERWRGALIDVKEAQFDEMET